MSSNTSEGTVGGSTELVLASWTDRFFAWLIDFIIVNAVLLAVFAAASVPFWIDGFPERGLDGPGGAARWAVTSLVFLGYWTYFESHSGQSLGKMALKIKTTNLRGGKADVRSAVIESFGKAFLLPIDLILGWIFSNDRRQRIFSKAGETVVIKLKGQDAGTEGQVHYTKE